MSSKPSSSDKERQQKHRTERLAAANNNGSSRNYLKDNQSDFLVKLAFDNNLPTVPAGGFFKKTMGMSSDKKDFAIYSMSSLEKSYVWQRHAAVDMNMSGALSLADQESVCEPQRAQHSLAREAEMYLEGSADKGRGNNKLHHISAHWWLRETKYSENGMARNYTVSKPEMQEAEISSLHYFDSEFIAASFEAIAKRDELDELVEWSLPLFPDDALADRSFAFTRFDEAPEDLLTRGEEEKEPQAAGKKRVRESVLTNIREIKKGSGQAFGVSLVVPTLGEENAGKFQWARDFAMDLNTSLVDHYLLLIDDKGKEVNYNNVNVYIDLQRLTVDQIHPHDCEVQRV